MQAEIGKTRISVSFAFVSVVTLMLILCDESIVLVSLFSSLFHEGGHLFFMLLFSASPTAVCFGAFGIRIERDTGKMLSGKKEALIALGGIAGNFLLIACSFVFFCVYGSKWALRLMTVNGFIALFNMLPVRSLDFGRCLECVFCTSETGEKCLSVISALTAVCIAVLCVLYNIFIGINVSLIAVSVYIIIVTLKE